MNFNNTVEFSDFHYLTRLCNSILFHCPKLSLTKCSRNKPIILSPNAQRRGVCFCTLLLSKNKQSRVFWFVVRLFFFLAKHSFYIITQWLWWCFGIQCSLEHSLCIYLSLGFVNKVSRIHWLWLCYIKWSIGILFFGLNKNFYKFDIIIIVYRLSFITWWVARFKNCNVNSAVYFVCI